MQSDTMDSELLLSRGWKWQLSLTGEGSSVVRVEQKKQGENEVLGAIAISVSDLPLITHWLRGSYTAGEWPPSRRFPGGTLLCMMPDPKPELWIEQFESEDTWVVGRPDTDRLGRLMLFEEDIAPG